MVTHDRVDLKYSIPHERLVVGSVWSGNTEKIRVHSLFMRYFLAVNHEHVWKQEAEAHLFYFFDLRSFYKNRKLYMQMISMRNDQLLYK